MKTRSLALALCLSLLGVACAHRSPVNEQWSRSTAATSAAQVADPNAPTSDAALLNLDAKSGEAVADRYYRGQRTQSTRQAPSVVISGGN